MTFSSHEPSPKFRAITLAVLTGLLVSFSQEIAAGENGARSGVPRGISGVSAAEVIKRQERVKAAQTLFTSGANAYADKSYAEAMDYFKAAFETIPDSPIVADQRQVFFTRYQAASYHYAQVLAAEARWAEAKRTLSDVIALAEAANIPRSAIDPDLKKMLDELENHDERYNQALSPRHLTNIELVKSKLLLAKGHMDLGDYDRADRAYNEALALDPTNAAARRGMELVERHRMEYYDQARNHTRAKQLSQVASMWESPVPNMATGDQNLIEGSDIRAAGSALVEQKLTSIIIPQIQFDGARLADIVDYLTMRTQELDTSSANPAERGVNFIIDSSGVIDGQPLGERPVNIRLSNIPLREAIRYAAQQAGAHFRVDNHAVTIIPLSVAADENLISRSFVVPPGFLSTSPSTRGSGPADPFSSPAAATTTVTRVTAQNFLEQSGVTFGAGAHAQFIPATSTLLVRNTLEQLSLIEELVRSARDSGGKNIEVQIRMLSIQDTMLRQAGVDWLLGQSNLGSSPQTFIGGGTTGSGGMPNPNDYAFVHPTGFPIGMHPITSGLRMGSIKATQSVQDVINRHNPTPGGGSAPGVFSVAGVFTDPQFQGVLRALSQLKGSDAMTTSTVLVKPGQQAKLEQVREMIYPTEYDPPEIPNQIGDTNGASFPVTPATPTAFETRHLGRIIDVEPTVDANNLSVNVNVALDFSDFTGFINYGTPITSSGPDGQPVVVTDNRIVMPIFDAIKETTNVDVYDGSTIAIGGLHGESISEAQDKIPFLGDLPVVGSAFKSTIKNSTKRAILIFVTVRILDPGNNPLNRKEEEEPQLVMTDAPPPRPVSSPPPPMIYPAK